MGEDNIQRTPKCVTRVCRFLGIWSYLIALFGSLAILIFLLIFSRWVPWNFVKGLMSVYWTAFPCLVGLSIACSQIAYRDCEYQIIQNDLDKQEKQYAKLDEAIRRAHILAEEMKNKKYDPEEAEREFEEKWGLRPKSEKNDNSGTNQEERG